MDEVSEYEKIESIKSLKSTIGKLEKSLVTMADKGANITLVRKRLNALQTGMALLESEWYNKPHSCSREDLESSEEILKILLPGIVKVYEKQKNGSPQRTLLERRIRSLELAILTIQENLDILLGQFGKA